MATILNRSLSYQIFIVRSSGDNFVQMMKQFKKVTVVGRPTLGILDYSNCCTVDYGNYQLMFPTSRCLSLDQGKGMTDQGVGAGYRGSLESSTILKEMWIWTSVWS